MSQAFWKSQCSQGSKLLNAQMYNRCADLSLGREKHAKEDFGNSLLMSHWTLTS